MLFTKLGYDIRAMYLGNCYNGLYRDYIEIYRNYRVHIWAIYGDNGRENGNYIMGFNKCPCLQFSAMDWELVAHLSVSDTSERVMPGAYATDHGSPSFELTRTHSLTGFNAS